MKNIFLIQFISLTFLLISCKNESKIDVSSENWIGKKIILPTSKLMKSESTKSINPLLKKTKILTIINGSCTVCIDELKKWKDYMKTVDTSQVGFIYLIQSEDDLFIFKELNRDYIKLSYPYFYDIKKGITKANKFTDNKADQTFLLNNKNEIILAGNPNRNKELFKQYNSEINKRIKKNNPTVVVKEGVAGTIIKISEGFVYKDQNGNILSTADVQKIKLNHEFVPHIDTDKGIITFKKR